MTPTKNILWLILFAQLLTAGLNWYWLRQVDDRVWSVLITTQSISADVAALEKRPW